MIVCPRCGKENQDHYKFCLGCGAELGGAEAPPAQPSAAPAPAAVASDLQVEDPALMPTQPPPPDVGTAGTQPPLASGESQPCPDCGTMNPVGFTFCGNCGKRLQGQSQGTLFKGGATPPSNPVPSTGPVARLALIRPDGSEGGSHVVQGPQATIGRGVGPLFDNDSYLSPTHAHFSAVDGQLMLEDAGSLNGVFVRITAEEPLYSGDVFRIGQELLRFDAIGEPVPAEDGTDVLGSPNPGYWGRLSLIVRRGVDGSAFPLMGDEMVLGRERGDILFSDDGYVSGTHAKLTITPQDEVFLVDLDSSNGTFVRLREPRSVPFGTFVLMGQQLFRVEAP